MSAQQVAKLEALLERVHGRRNAQRDVSAPPEPAATLPVQDAAGSRIAAASGAPGAAARPAVVPVAPVTPAPMTPAPVTPAPVTPLHVAEAPRPVAGVPVASPPAAATAGSAHATPTKPPMASVPPADLEVEVEEGMAEVDLEGLDEDEQMADSGLSDSVADLDQVAPASSRRPIQLQPPLEDLAFGDTAEAKAPHPAPPESRRQVAIPPASDFDAELSGVRATPEVVATPAAAAAPPLHAEVTRPVVASASPAVFRGAAPFAAPATVGELLDATLGL